MLGRKGNNALIDERCTTAVAALESDPFYRSICGGYGHDAVGRRLVLERYFAYSIEEGEDLGRCFHLAGRARGVAVWLLPQSAGVQSLAARNKRAFLEQTLDEEGCANYYRIFEFMTRQSEGVVGDDAWYLSIVAVHPTAQGQGLGRKLWNRRLPKRIAAPRPVISRPSITEASRSTSVWGLP